jgi:16S rRNA processing protein RimM
MKLVGKVKEAHGLKGDLHIMIFAGEAAWLKQLKKFSIKSKLEGEFEMEVSSVKPFKSGFILKTPQVTDRTFAEKLKGAEFLIPEELLVSKEGETIYLSEILNFKLKNPEQTVLGIVSAFSNNGAHDILTIQTPEGKAVEIPFVDAFIKKLDFKNQTLVMDLPEGLFDIENV